MIGKQVKDQEEIIGGLSDSIESFPPKGWIEVVVYHATTKKHIGTEALHASATIEQINNVALKMFDNNYRATDVKHISELFFYEIVRPKDRA